MTESYELCPRFRAIQQKLQPFFPGLFISVSMSWKDWDNYEDVFSAPISISLYKGDNAKPPCIATRRIKSGMVGLGDIEALSDQVHMSEQRKINVTLMSP